MLLKKFRGCLMGALAGDCFGAPFEGEQLVNANQLQNYFDKLEGPPFKTPAYKYTDDTAMTISVAEWLVEKNGQDYRSLARRFMTEYFSHPNRGYGANMANLFSQMKNENLNDIWQPAIEQFGGSGSYGNGGAMRVSPIALYFHKEITKLIEATKSVTRLTHTNPMGVNGAILQALAISSSLTHEDNELNPIEYAAHLLDLISLAEKNDERVVPEKETYGGQMKKVVDLLQKEDQPGTDVVVDELGHNVTAIYSVPTAIYCFLRASKPISHIKTENAFRRTIQYAISLGGDTDTIASMAGAIAGSFYGIDVINPRLVELCEYSTEMDHLARRLYDKSSHQE